MGDHGIHQRMICQNKTSTVFFNKLPFQIRKAFMEHLEYLEMLVRTIAPKTRFTSGFRSPGNNKSVGGVINSLHQYGCAVDVSLDSLNEAQIIALEEHGCQVLKEKTHFHISFTGDLSL